MYTVLKFLLIDEEQRNVFCGFDSISIILGQVETGYSCTISHSHFRSPNIKTDKRTLTLLLLYYYYFTILLLSPPFKPVQRIPNLNITLYILWNRENGRRSIFIMKLNERWSAHVEGHSKCRDYFTIITDEYYYLAGWKIWNEISISCNKIKYKSIIRTKAKTSGVFQLPMYVYRESKENIIESWMLQFYARKIFLEFLTVGS